ncbi:hypothetical protein LY78DRAFT_466664 [Colletotrichum sublineola]|nr:hypothetical protein LY78DRAFT_466664 [Colletotrichum sublineola]
MRVRSWAPLTSRNALAYSFLFSKKRTKQPSLSLFYLYVAFVVLIRLSNSCFPRRSRSYAQEPTLWDVASSRAQTPPVRRHRLVSYQRLLPRPRSRRRLSCCTVVVVDVTLTPMPL